MPTTATLDDSTFPKPSAPLGLLPEHGAENFPDARFVADLPWSIYDGTVDTFGGFAAAVAHVADRLWAGGIRADDTVVVLHRNHIEVEAILFAISRIGAVPALLTPAMEPAELLESLAKLAQPKLLVDTVGATRLDGYRHAVSFLTTDVLAWQRPQGGLDARVLDTSDTHQTNPRDPKSAFAILHSSGTTGTPKLISHSAESLFGMVAPMIVIFKSQYGNGDLNAKYLSYVHSRTCAGTLASLETGLPMVSLTDPSPANVARMVTDLPITALETHPNVFIHWEGLAASPDRPFRDIQRFISTFDAIHPRTVRTLLASSDRPDAHYLQAYGQTESGPVCLRIVTRDDAAAYSPRNVGFPGLGIEIRITDAAGSSVAVGRPGAIETKTPGRMLGYVGSPQPATDGEWWPMGDVGRIAEDGSLELLDRAIDHVDGDDSLLETEDALLDRLPDLAELVLLGAVAGEYVAVAAPKHGATGDEAELRSAAADLGVRVDKIHFWPWEALPLTGSFKVRRGVLRAILETRAALQSTATSEELS